MAAGARQLHGLRNINTSDHEFRSAVITSLFGIQYSLFDIQYKHYNVSFSHSKNSRCQTIAFCGLVT